MEVPGLAGQLSGCPPWATLPMASAPAVSGPPSARWQSAVSKLAEQLRWTGLKGPAGAKVGPKIATGEVLDTLRLCSKNSWSWLTELLERLQVRGTWPTVVTPTAGLAGYGRAQLWQEAENLLSRMSRTLQVDAVALSAAVGACEGAWQRALRLLAGDVEHTARGFTSAASACARTSEWALTLGLLQGSSASNIVSLTAAVTGCEKVSRWSKALFLSDAARQSRLCLDIMALNSVMQACAEGEQWQVSLELRPKSSEMDMVSHNIVTKACSRSWERAVRNLGSMLQALIRPDLVGYSASISACGPKAWQRAHRLFSDLSSGPRRPDIVACGSTLNAMEAEWPMALSAFHELLQQQLQLDAPAYNSLLSAESGGWALKLSLLQTRTRLLGLDAASAGAVILACCAASAWSVAVNVLDSLERHRIAPSTHAIASVMSACEQKGLPQVRDQMMLKLAAATVDGVPPPPDAAATLRAAIWEATACKSRQEPDKTPALPPILQAPSERQGLYRYFKELQLLRYVLKQMELAVLESGSHRAQAVCEAIEAFGLQGSSRWLKVVGNRKAQVLEAAVRGAVQGSEVLEIGTYCGYSALRMAQCLPGVPIHTLEADPVHVVIASNILALVGREADAVHIWTGHSQVLLPQWCRKAQFGAVFMDQRGSRYDEDLDILEARGLLSKAAVIVADNVLKPGAPLFLWRLQMRGYEYQILSMQEFAMPCEDWMTVSVGVTALPHPSSSPPARILELHYKAETIRKLATKKGGASVSFEEWSTFAGQMRRALSTLGLRPTAEISDALLEQRSSPRLGENPGLGFGA